MKKPTAHERKSRPGQWEAKGVDTCTGKRKSFYGSTAEEASEIASRSFGIVVDSSLYSYYANVYLPTVVNLSENYKVQIAWAMDHYVIPVFGNYNVTEIDRQLCQQAFNRWCGCKTKLSGKTISPRSLHTIKKIFTAVLNLAVEDGVIERNPVSKVRTPPIVRREDTILHPHELRLLSLEATPMARSFIYLQGYCGLRIGEACGVTRGHIRNNILYVRQQITQASGAWKSVV